MARQLRESKQAGQVDRHHIYFSFHTADDAAPDPGARWVSVGIRDEARKSKGQDADGNDRYRPLQRKLTAKELGMKADELLDALALEALAADEARAAALESEDE